MKEKGKYYTLGLDVGTNSVGWALVNQDHKLVKRLGHSMWGVRLFEESSDAKGRRLNRGNRRRVKRRRERVELLQNIFKEEVDKIDSNFFTRLNESFYLPEDSKIPEKTLFGNKELDKEYYEKYPTIWHLRYALLNEDRKFDIREVYLAIQHIVKYRGNFLTEGSFDIKSNEVIKTSLELFMKSIDGASQKISDECVDDEDLQEYAKTLKSKEVDNKLIDQLTEIMLSGDTRNDKKRRIVDLFGKENISGEILPELLVNGRINLSNNKPKICKAFDKFEKIEIDFGADNFEEKLDEAVLACGPITNVIYAFREVKQVYEFYWLKKFLGEEKWISSAFLNEYIQHRKDLKELKNEIFKKYLPEEYRFMFKNAASDDGAFYKEKGFTDEEIKKFISKRKFNYSYFIGKNNGERLHFGLDDIKDKKGKFYDYLKMCLDIIKRLNQENTSLTNKLDSILKKIEDGDYLTKQNDAKNGSIPMQLHSLELNSILEKQAKYYDFLNKKDSEGKSNEFKIKKIFSFKRPYYVGTLKGEYSWSILNDNKGKIYPWNFDERLDAGETAKAFIERMQNKCTYIKSDYCLPKASIIFQKYTVLSYLNKIKISHSNIDKDLKQKLYNEFLNKPKVTKKDIESFLYTNANIKNEDLDVDICNVSMSSYNQFKKVFGGALDDEKIELAEKIIKDVTIFEDKSILAKRLKEIYRLTDEQIKQVKSFNYSGYGRLGNVLLKELPIIKINHDGEVLKSDYKGIVDIMWDTDLELQGILNSPDYNLKDAIDAYNEEKTPKEEYNENDEKFINEWTENNLTISPVWIRPFIQSYRIIKDIRDILAKSDTDISYYVVECTRTNKDKTKGKRTESRYERLSRIIKESVEQNKEEILSELDSKKDAVNFSDKLYLYFSQLCKDAYTLEDIDINELEQEYDIDHIYPQSLIKDDSLSNRVLTRKKYNNEGKGSLLLPDIRRMPNSIIAKGADNFYKMLYDKGLINKIKYERLTEKKINWENINGFINRQKTATDQATKSLIELIKYLMRTTSKSIIEIPGEKEKNDYINSHIIYSKAENISDFRHKYKIYKSRTANNFHHAHDAYLNAILGKTLKDYYDDKGLYDVKDFDDKNKNEDDKFTTLPLKILDERIKKTKKDKDGNRRIIWNGKEEIDCIYKTITKNFDIQETRRSFVGNQFLSKLTVLEKGKGNVPVKSSTPNGNRFDINKYGGYSSPSYNYFKLFKLVDKKGSVEYRLLPVSKATENSDEKLVRSYLNVNNYKEYEVVCDNVRYCTTMEIQRKRYCFTGVKNGSFYVLNLKDRIFNIGEIKIIHDIDKIIEDLNTKNLHQRSVFDIENKKIILHKGKHDDSNDVQLSVHDLEKIYEKLLNLWSNPAYAFSNISELSKKMPAKLFESHETIDEFEFKRKLELLNQMLILLKTNQRGSADLSKIGLAKSSGILSHSFLIEPGTKFVSYSPTGLRKKIIYEVKDEE